MIVFLTELNTRATYNGIVYTNNDLAVLVNNFKRMIINRFNIREADMRIKIHQ